MHRAVALTLCLSWLAIAQPDRRVQPIVAHRQVALVIGNGAYAARPLKNPVNDAQAMGRRLRELNYDVTVVTDATRKSMGEAIDRFVDKLTTGDVAFFYYSGHGAQVDGENYLVPVDFSGQTETDIRYDAHPAGRIQERMEKSGAQLNIMVLDACRDNPFHSTSRGAGSGLASMSGGRGTFIAFATSPGRTASDNPDGQFGLFTEHLLQAMATPDLSLDDVFNLVRERVDSASAGKQLPWSLSSVVGRYSFVSGGAPTQPADPLQQARDRLVRLMTTASNTVAFPQPCMLMQHGSGVAFTIPLEKLSPSIVILRKTAEGSLAPESSPPFVDPSSPRLLGISTLNEGAIMRFDPGQNQWQPLKSGLALEVTDRAAAEEASSALSRIAGACRSSQPVDPLQQTRERLTQLLTFDTPQASNSASFRQSCLLEYRFTQPGGGYSIATLVPLGSIPSNLYL